MDGVSGFVTFAPLEQIKVLPPSNCRQATVHRTVVFAYSNPSVQTKIKGLQKQPFYFWSEYHYGVSVVGQDYSISTPARGASMEQWILPRAKKCPLDTFCTSLRTGAALSNPDTIKILVTTFVVTRILVGVSGFEPEASWTRTKRDTKLRHTPIAKLL